MFNIDIAKHIASLSMLELSQEDLEIDGDVYAERIDTNVAIMIETTPVYEYVDIPKIISLTSNKEKGMGGIDTKGVARRIY